VTVDGPFIALIAAPLALQTASCDNFAISEQRQEVWLGKQHPRQNPPKSVRMFVDDMFVDPSQVFVDRGKRVRVFPLFRGAFGLHIRKSGLRHVAVHGLPAQRQGADPESEHRHRIFGERLNFLQLQNHRRGSQLF